MYILIRIYVSDFQLGQKQEKETRDKAVSILKQSTGENQRLQQYRVAIPGSFLLLWLDILSQLVREDKSLLSFQFKE